MMTFSLLQILIFIVIYLSGLFAVAHLADRGIIPERVTTHPATYILSLGVFAGALGTNGVISLAHTYGYSFLLYYVGVVAMFVTATVLLLPLRWQQPGSLLQPVASRGPWPGQGPWRAAPPPQRQLVAPSHCACNAQGIPCSSGKARMEVNWN